MKSVWKEAEMPQFPSLKGDLNTDVLIIGGGIFGVLTAYFLQNKGVSYILCEKDRICEKNTGNTTAKLTVQHGLIYSKLIESFGIERAQMYYRANEAALSEYFRLCQTIDCDFETKENCIYRTDDRRALEKELSAIERIGAKAYLKENLPLPIKTVGGVCFQNQGQFHPLKFLSHISQGLNIFENTFITNILNKTAYYEGGKIEAKKIVIATHYPFLNRYGSYFMKLYQDRSYVIALEKANAVDGMYMDGKTSGFSFRNYGDLLLLGGMSHKTGECKSAFDMLREFANEKYPGSKEMYAWAAQDCISLDGVPYIGRYSKLCDGLYTATGFNKWGMTSSMVAAMMICSEIVGEKMDYAPVFSPSRSILKPQLCKNIASYAKNLVTPAKKRCSHMGCTLKWNSKEKTWDCPCHGSRFSKDGEILENPSNKRLF